MNEPSYYAIIPAPVRYHRKISSGAKLLFGEISALCSKKGFCWATNQYFADLYDSKKTTISEWVSQLVKAGFLRIEVDSSRGNERKIFMMGGVSDITEEVSDTAGEVSEKTEPSIKESNKESIATPLHQPSLIKAEPSYKKFIPPSKPDCRVAAHEAGIPMEEGDKFWDHHNSAGWFLSRGRKMKEWRSAFSTWTRNHKKFESDKPKPKAKSIFIG